MIYLFHGENEFLKRQRLTELVVELGGQIDRIDGNEMTLGDLREILFGQTLFGSDRLAVVSDLSESQAWQHLPDLADKSDTTIILLEQKVDKRTKTYKWIQKNAKAEEFMQFKDYEKGKVVGWLVARSKDHHGFTIERRLAESLVDRLGHDQLRLDSVLEQLSLVDQLDQDTLDKMLPLSKSQSVFGLLAASLDGRVEDIKKIIAYLELTDGPEGVYLTVGLLSSQLIALNALVLGGERVDVVDDLSASPYTVNGVKPYTSKVTASQLSQINSALAQADLSMKTSTVAPWLLLETALVKVANIVKA